MRDRDGGSLAIHPTAVVEEGAVIGAGTKVWHQSHVRSGSRIGRGCTIGFAVYVDDRWLAWNREVASALTSGSSYRFRFEREGYFPRTYSLVLQPYQSVLRLEAQLIPTPGTLRLESNAGALVLRLNGSQYFFAGGKDRSYQKLDPLEEGTRDLRLSPGQYLVSVQLNASLSRSLSVRVAPGQTLTLKVELDRAQRTLSLAPVE